MIVCGTNRNVLYKEPSTNSYSSPIDCGCPVSSWAHGSSVFPNSSVASWSSQLASTSAPTSVAARLVSPRQARRPPISANAAAAAWIPLQHAALLQTPTTAWTAVTAQSHHGPMSLRSSPTPPSLASPPSSPLQLASTSALIGVVA